MLSQLNSDTIPKHGLIQYYCEKSGLERWATVADGLRYPDAEMDLDELFLFEDQRTVQNDRTVSLHGRVFEVDAALTGQRVTLRYDPSRPDAPVQVVHQGQPIGQARQVDLYANCFVKRQRRTGALEADRQAEPPASALSLTALDNQQDDEDPQGGAR